MMVTCRRAQTGQALTEALVVMAVFIVLVQALVWLWRAHAVAVSSQHASAHAAFLFTRAASNSVSASSDTALVGTEALSWLEKQASVVSHTGGLNAALGLDAIYSMPSSGSSSAAVQADRLASQWLANDRRVHRATVNVDIPGFAPLQAPQGSHVPLRLRRFTAILANAGHASSDASAQHRLGQSSDGWADAAQTSYALSRRIHDSVAAIDAAWDRPVLLSEWLSHWHAVAPAGTASRQGTVTTEQP
jgi:hypothetical protein